MSQNGYEIENSFDWRRSVTGRLTFLLQLSWPQTAFPFTPFYTLKKKRRICIIFFI